MNIDIKDSARGTIGKVDSLAIHDGGTDEDDVPMLIIRGTLFLINRSVEIQIPYSEIEDLIDLDEEIEHDVEIETQEHNRSAVNGQFVSEEEAAANPYTTVHETS